MSQQLRKPHLSAVQHLPVRPLPCHAVKAARTHRTSTCASLTPPNPQQLRGGVQRSLDNVNPARILQLMTKQQDANSTSPAAAAEAQAAPAATVAESPQTGQGSSGRSSNRQALSLPKQLAAAVAQAGSAMLRLRVSEPPKDAATAAAPTTDDRNSTVVRQAQMPDLVALAGSDFADSGSCPVGIQGDTGSFLVITSQPQEVSTLQRWSQSVAANFQGSTCKSSSSSSNDTANQNTGSAPGKLVSCTAGAVQHHSSGTVEAVQQYSGSTSVASSTATATSSVPDSQLRFAKHLAVVSNGCASPSSRFESLGWLLFESNRQQAALGLNDKLTNPSGNRPKSQTLAQAWLASSQGRQLLQQIYLIGQAVADLGTADGLQPLSCSNGSRAIVSLDYAKLLERYLQQHGQLLVPDVWVHWPDDELQAKAIHVSTCLETRCRVHSLLFEKLIQRVGLEAVLGGWSHGSQVTAAVAGGGSGGVQHPTGSLATAISNTIINTSQLMSSPSISQAVVAAPSASATGNTSNVSVTSNNSASSSNSSPSAAAKRSSWLNLSSFDTVLVVIWHAAGKMLKLIVVVAMFVKDLAVQLMLLRAIRAAAQGLTQLAREVALPQNTQTFPVGGKLSSAAEDVTIGRALQRSTAAALAAKPQGRQPPAQSAPPSPGGLDAVVHYAAALKAAAAIQPAAAAIQPAAAVQPATAAVQPAGGNPQGKVALSAAGMAPVGCLGLLSSVPVVGSKAAEHTVRPRLQQLPPQQRQKSQQQRQQGQSSALQEAGSRSREIFLRRQQAKDGVRFNPQLLYQLWAPEAARSA